MCYAWVTENRNLAVAIQNIHDIIVRSYFLRFVWLLDDAISVAWWDNWKIRFSSLQLQLEKKVIENNSTEMNERSTGISIFMPVCNSLIHLSQLTFTQYYNTVIDDCLEYN